MCWRSDVRGCVCVYVHQENAKEQAKPGPDIIEFIYIFLRGNTHKHGHPYTQRGRLGYAYGNFCEIEFCEKYAHVTTPGTHAAVCYADV